jgi:hypothetical protein
MDSQTKLLLVVLALVLVFSMSREHFLPSSKYVPPCPAGSERGSNGLDCKSQGDRYGM